MGGVTLGHVVHGCVRKQADQAIESKPATAFLWTVLVSASRFPS